MIPGSALMIDADEAFKAQRSVILRQSVSGFFSFTNNVGAAIDSLKWTFSAWIKRSSISAGQGVYSIIQNGVAYPAPMSAIYLDSSNKLAVWNGKQDGTGGSAFVTSSSYTSTSTWLHVVVAVDTTQATASDRVKLYVNNSLQSWGTVGSTGWAQNSETGMRPANGFGYGYLGFTTLTAGALTLDGKVSEHYFIDSQTLTPSSFGVVNPITSAWVPKRYGGSYGTKSRYVNFSNPASALTIGYDYSGKNNNITGSNLSLPSDSSTDVPA